MTGKIVNYTVYLLPKGGKRELLAKFVEPVDAINYAYDKSKGQYCSSETSVSVVQARGYKKVVRYCKGVSV